jgi:hypothetical protein
MKPLRTLILTTVLLAACNTTPDDPASLYAMEMCEAYCEACASVETCPDICFSQWSTFAGHSTKSECADRYLFGIMCQTEECQCDDPVCGDPVEDMWRWQSRSTTPSNASRHKSGKVG